MKRRGFLQLLSGAITAPLLPNASLAQASKAAYPASALHAAIYHAQSRVNFSVFALAQQLGLQLGQAEQLMSDMSARGILGPLQGSTRSGRWARSKVWTHPMAKARAAQEATKSKDARTATDKSGDTTEWADMRPFMTHLYDLCRKNGMTLHPRCAA